MARLRLLSLQAVRGLLNAKSFTASEDRVVARLVADWLAERGLVSTLAALQIETVPASWHQGHTPLALADVQPPRFPVPTLPLFVPTALPAPAEADAILLGALDKHAVDEIRAHVANLVLCEFKDPGSRVRALPLDSPERVAQGMAVAQWLEEKALKHTRDVLEAECGLAIDPAALPAGYSLTQALHALNGNGLAA